MNRLEDLHKIGFLHLDIKPDNILLGNSDHNGTLFLIDFGISKRYLDNEGQHIPLRKGIPFLGNVVFASKTAFFEQGNE